LIAVEATLAVHGDSVKRRIIALRTTSAWRHSIRRSV
jgi:hypothetical protein